MTGERLTRTQFVLLIVAALAPGMEQAEIAQLGSYDPATAGVVISKLEARGLVRRERSRRSRRGWIVEATPKGHAVIEERIAILDVLQNEVLSPLEPDERLVFLRLLSKLVRIGNSYNGEAGRSSPM